MPKSAVSIDQIQVQKPIQVVAEIRCLITVGVESSIISINQEQYFDQFLGPGFLKNIFYQGFRAKRVQNEVFQVL